MELKRFLDENGIEILYVSIDPGEQEVNWQNAIKKYGLTGHHIRTSHPLHVDMDTNYDINEFPRYMVVDKNGEIVVDKAKYPQEGEKLYGQIKTALGL